MGAAADGGGARWGSGRGVGSDRWRRAGRTCAPKGSTRSVGRRLVEGLAAIRSPGAPSSGSVPGSMMRRALVAFPVVAALALACGPAHVAATPPANRATIDDPQMRELVRLVNAQRQRRGIPPLAWSAPLARVAVKHSADMVRRHYFSHVDPDGRDPFDRMRAAGLDFSAAGENIAAGQRDAATVFASWMDSRHHRENILSRDYTQMGIGRFDHHWTQLFMTPRSRSASRRYR